MKKTTLDHLTQTALMILGCEARMVRDNPGALQYEIFPPNELADFAGNITLSVWETNASLLYAFSLSSDRAALLEQVNRLNNLCRYAKFELSLAESSDILASYSFLLPKADKSDIIDTIAGAVYLFAKSINDAFIDSIF